MVIIQTPIKSILRAPNRTLPSGVPINVARHEHPPFSVMGSTLGLFRRRGPSIEHLNTNIIFMFQVFCILL